MQNLNTTVILLTLSTVLNQLCRQKPEQTPFPFKLEDNRNSSGIYEVPMSHSYQIMQKVWKAPQFIPEDTCSEKTINRTVVTTVVPERLTSSNVMLSTLPLMTDWATDVPLAFYPFYCTALRVGQLPKEICTRLMLSVNGVLSAKAIRNQMASICVK